MANEALSSRLKNLILPVLEQDNAILIELDVKGSPGNLIIRVFADTETGIQIDQCTRLTREISDLLEIEDIIRGHYRIEVSSPGLDRPLKTHQDFRRNIGRRVKIHTTPDDDNKTVKDIGEIIEVDDKFVTIRTLKTGAQKTFAIDSIKKAVIQIAWS